MVKRKNNRKKSRRNKLSKFFNALQRLKKLNAKDQHEAISMANNTFIRQFCKQLKKLKHAKITPTGKKALRKHKTRLRQLLKPNIGFSKRRRILTQGGGGFLKTILRFIPFIGPFANLLPDNI